MCIVELEGRDKLFSVDLHCVIQCMRQKQILEDFLKSSQDDKWNNHDETIFIIQSNATYKSLFTITFNCFQYFTLTLSNSIDIWFWRNFQKLKKYIHDIDNGLYWSNDAKTQIGINLRNKVISTVIMSFMTNGITAILYVWSLYPRLAAINLA